MAIGRRSFLAGIGAALAAPFTALVPARFAVVVGMDFGKTDNQSVWLVRWGQAEPVEVWPTPPNADEWLRLCRKYRLKLEAIDGNPRADVHV